MNIQWSEKYVHIEDLKEYDRNPRRIKDAQYKNLVKSLIEDGYHQRLVVNTDLTIIGGHQRKRALLEAGFGETDKIPVLMPSRKLEGDDFKRLNIRDNLPYGEFDFDMLASDFDIDELIDWGMPEEWLPNVEVTEDGLTDDDAVPEVPKEPKTKLGDIYALGNHRLMCGDSTSIDNVEKLMDGLKADMVFTDPPYGVDEKTERHKAGRGKLAKSHDFERIIGDSDCLTAIDAYNLCFSMGIPLLVFFGANYYSDKLYPISSWIIWDKREGKGRDDNADCEMAWSNRGGAARIFSHLWKGCIKASEHGETRVHPTQKPVALAEWVITEYPKERVESVLDLFGGSGSTLIACEKTNRKCFMMELSPHYCDVIVKRWEDFTGKKAERIDGS